MNRTIRRDNVIFVLQLKQQVSNRLSFAVCGIEVAVEQLQEDPLRPFVVTRIGGVHFAVPVVAQTQRLDLSAEVFDVLFRWWSAG